MQSLLEMQRLRVITAAVKGALREICQIEGQTPAELYRLLSGVGMFAVREEAGPGVEAQLLGYPLPYNPSATTVLAALAELMDDESEG